MDYGSSLLCLFDALIEDAPARRLVDIAREYLGNPIHISDHNLEIIAHSKESGIKDKIWNLVTSPDARKHYEVLCLAQEQNDLGKMGATKEPMLMSDKVHDRRTIGQYIWWGNKILGHIMLVEYYQDFRDSDFSYIKELGKIFAFKIIHDNNLEFVRNPDAEMALASLLNKRYISAEIIARNLFQPDSAKHYVLSVAESMPEKNIHQMPPSILNIFFLTIREGRMVMYQDRIVMLFQCYKLEEIDWEKYEPFFTKYYIRCGVSNPFMRLEDIHNAYDQAQSALRTSVFFAPQGHVYRYFPLFHIFDIINQNKIMMSFVHPAIFKLLNYDALYHTKLFSNLTVFVFSGCDIQQTASILRVHKNTIHYRINKIEEISGYSLKDDNLVFLFKLSIFILYYLERDSFYEEYDVPRSLVIFPERV
ncbi:MAG: helix-turn-helix domain-containing protein [Treponema sp.]|jgi:hypothetical protein|nr:helix-turn-helix domain-containing protein [Treponema sp.]